MNFKGELSERSKVPHSKCGLRRIDATWVRIPCSPFHKNSAIKIELLKECFDQVLNEYNDKYDFLYFGYSCGLVYYDIVNSDIQVKIIDRSDYDKLMYAARVKTDI